MQQMHVCERFVWSTLVLRPVVSAVRRALTQLRSGRHCVSFSRNRKRLTFSGGSAWGGKIPTRSGATPQRASRRAGRVVAVACCAGRPRPEPPLLAEPRLRLRRASSAELPPRQSWRPRGSSCAAGVGFAGTPCCLASTPSPQAARVAYRAPAKRCRSFVWPARFYAQVSLSNTSPLRWPQLARSCSPFAYFRARVLSGRAPPAEHVRAVPPRASRSCVSFSDLLRVEFRSPSRARREASFEPFPPEAFQVTFRAEKSLWREP